MVYSCLDIFLKIVSHADIICTKPNLRIISTLLTYFTELVILVITVVTKETKSTSWEKTRRNNYVTGYTIQREKNDECCQAADQVSKDSSIVPKHF
jgi:hypothetical protein